MHSAPASAVEIKCEAGCVHGVFISRARRVAAGMQGSVSARAQRFAAALELGGVPSPVVGNIRADIFMKAVNSAAFNAVAVLTGATIGQIADCGHSIDVLRSVMAELEQLASVRGLPTYSSQVMACAVACLVLECACVREALLRATMRGHALPAMLQATGLRLPQTAEERIAQTLTGRTHKMSMLHDIELCVPGSASPPAILFYDEIKKRHAS
jgi:ketopantoate reductase